MSARRKISWICMLVASVVLGVSGEFVEASLLTNGDFELGNTGFSTEFTYRPDANKNVPGYLDADQYVITDDLYKIHHLTDHMYDHTSGNGKMLVVNGTASAPATIWEATVNVQSQTTYEFSLWVTGWKIVSGASPGAAGRFAFYVDGQQFGDEIVAPLNSLTSTNWQEHDFAFDSGNSTSVVLAVVNTSQDLGGNDFAFDDFSLNANPVPEPATIAVWSILGLCGIGYGVRRKMRRAV